VTLSIDLRRGHIVDFDDHVGLGVVEEEGGARRRYPFHCTQIAGGTRTIALGTVVTFAVVAGRGGRWEAGGVTPA
jgi:cold shock CspA family protein